MIVSAFSTDGGIQLEVESNEPQNPRVPVLVLAHPHPRMGGNMNNKVIDQLFRRAVERRWGAVRFNFRGVGQSTGIYEGGVGEAEDVLGVLAWASSSFQRPMNEMTLVGYSFGSYACALAAAKMTALKSLYLIAPPVATMDFSPILSSRLRKHIFAAEQDEFVPKEKLDGWYSQLSPPKTLQIVPEADHFFVGHTTELVRIVLRSVDQDS